MSLQFYFDHNMPRPLAAALRQAGVDVITALEDGAGELNDRELWLRTIEYERIFVTQDRDFLTIAYEFQANNTRFPGLIVCQIPGVPSEQLVEELALIAHAAPADEMQSAIRWVPL